MPWALPLVGIDVLLVVLWCIAAALAIAVVMAKVGDVLGGIPAVGGALRSAAHAIARAITGACGALMSGIESLVGAGLHLLARYLDELFAQFLRHATLIAHLAEVVGGALYDLSGVRGLVKDLGRLAHGIDRLVRETTRKFEGIDKELRSIEHQLAHGIGADVQPLVKSLDRELHQLERSTSRRIASAEAQAEAATADLWGWLTGLGTRPLTETFAAAIAVALGTLGLSGLRCNSLLSALSSRGCGLWQGLEDLLGLLFDAIIFTDLCGVLPEAERLFADLEAPLVELVASAADAACAQPPQGWVELASPALSLPPVYYAGTVPGN